MHPQNENLYKGSQTILSEADIEGPLAGCPNKGCAEFTRAYADEGVKAKDAGKPDEAALFQFLSALTSFAPNFDVPEAPFAPFWQSQGQRSRIPSDLSIEDLAALRVLASRSRTPALRARLYDVVWVVGKDHLAAAEAAKQYIQAGKSMDIGGNWLHAGPCLQRGIYLAGVLGRDKDLYKQAVEAVETAARNCAAENEKFRCSRYLSLLIKFSCSNPAEFGQIASSIATKSEEQGDSYRARAYWEAAEEFWQMTDNKVERQKAKFAAAETYIKEAEKRTQGATPSFLAAAAVLVNGIEALRRAGATNERITQLRGILAEHQEKSMKEMKEFSTEIDISAMVAAALEHVKSDNLPNALFKFAIAHTLQNLDGLKKEVLETAEMAPLSHLFASALVDSKGRVTANRPGLHGSDGDDREAAVEALMFERAQLHWSLRASAYIEPARQQIRNDHHPSLDDLKFMVQNNPFVPPGHEGIFLRGIHAGFHGDFLVASHLLVPQIENSLRFVLEGHGVDVSNLLSDGTQPLKMLGPVMEMAKRIFGEDLCFELRGCLIEKAGFKFRDHLAHGFVTYAGCYSAAPMNIWWLVCRLCLLPVYAKSQDAPRNAGE